MLREALQRAPFLRGHITVNDSPPSVDPPAADIGTVIAHLAAQQAALSRYVDRRWPRLDTVHPAKRPWSEAETPGETRGEEREMARLLSLYGQNAARLGCLLRDWHAIHGPPPDTVQQGIDHALHQAGAQLGLDLIDPALLDRDGPGQPPVDLDDLISDLDGKQTRLARHLDHCAQDGGEDHPTPLLAVYSRNAACLGRLLRLRHTLARPISAELEDLFARTIDDPEQLFQEACDASERSGRSAA